ICHGIFKNFKKTSRPFVQLVLKLKIKNMSLQLSDFVKRDISYCYNYFYNEYSKVKDDYFFQSVNNLGTEASLILELQDDIYRLIKEKKWETALKKAILNIAAINVFKELGHDIMGHPKKYPFDRLEDFMLMNMYRNGMLRLARPSQLAKVF